MKKSNRNVIYISLGAPHLEYESVKNVLAERSINAQMIHIDDINTVDWSVVNLVNLRMCRGYHKVPSFNQKIEALHQKLQGVASHPIPMANNINLIRDAVDKGKYLRQLNEEDGIGTIPTRWIAKGGVIDIQALMTETTWDDIVIKPTVSSGSWNTLRLSKTGKSTSDSHIVLNENKSTVKSGNEALSSLLTTHQLCVQPFLSSVLEFGELSFVFLAGKFSHAIRKTVGNNGGWWAHERLGGINHQWSPSEDELGWAYEIYQVLERRYGWLWFGRIDGIKDAQGNLKLLECELAIPRLLLPDAGAFSNYAEAIHTGLERLSY